MSEFDLVLKNGTVFLPSGRENTDIGIKKDKITIPNALKLDFKFKVCFVDIINPAKIQN